MRIYTRQGDNGLARRLDGQRVPKDDLRLEAEGCLDELSSALGLAASLGDDSELQGLIENVQRTLFALGAVLARDGEPDAALGVGEADVRELEREIDRLQEELPPRRSLILPGGAPPAAQLHVARTVCRRLERRLVSLSGEHPLPPAVLAYVNRLSDLLFVAARATNQRAGAPETPWNSRSSAE